MSRNIYILLAVMLFVMAACKKNEQDTEYKDVPRIHLEGSSEENAGKDTVAMTFTLLSPEVTESTLTLVAKISGYIADSDRTFRIMVDPAGTTALASEYILPNEFVIKAGAISANVPVTVKKTPRMDDMSVTLTLKVETNENFYESEQAKFKFVWSNDLIKPSTWDMSGRLISYVGKYSRNKHRLIVEHTEFRDLDQYNNFDIFILIKDKINKALQEYNAGKTESEYLKNDQDQVISICNNCP